MTWNFELAQKRIPELNKPILIVGLPGIGNVGKITADFIIDEIKAQRLYSISSYEMPNSVFVNDKDLIELPSIELYCRKRARGNDILVLTGDVQPADERGSYEFCEKVLDKAQELDVELVITLGGIGLAEAPKKPEVFCTGNSRELIKKFGKSITLKEKLYGIVGPIIGVSGLLVGLAGKRKMPAVCLLAETLGHPAYLGIKGARELVKVLNKKFTLAIKLDDLDKEIEDIEAEVLTKTQELGKASKSSALKKLQGRIPKETSYIG
jgi:hypothetical protein